MRGEFSASLRVTQSGSRFDEMPLASSIPQRVLRGKAVFRERNLNGGNGFSWMYCSRAQRALHSRTTTFCLPRDASQNDNDRDGQIVSLFYDLISLLCRGHLTMFENPTSGRVEIEVDAM